MYTYVLNVFKDMIYLIYEYVTYVLLDAYIPQCFDIEIC